MSVDPLVRAFQHDAESAQSEVALLRSIVRKSWNGELSDDPYVPGATFSDDERAALQRALGDDTEPNEKENR